MFRMELSWRTHVCTQVSCLEDEALSGHDGEACMHRPLWLPVFIDQWNLTFPKSLSLDRA